jgi:phosphatidylserine synthase
MQELNKELLIYLNSFLDYQIIEKITLVFADIPIFFLPIFLVVAWLFYSFKSDDINKKKDLLFIFYSCVISIIINLTIQNFIKIDRPETVLE